MSHRSEHESGKIRSCLRSKRGQSAKSGSLAVENRDSYTIVMPESNASDVMVGLRVGGRLGVLQAGR